MVGSWESRTGILGCRTGQEKSVCCSEESHSEDCCYGTIWHHLQDKQDFNEEKKTLKTTVYYSPSLHYQANPILQF